MKYTDKHKRPQPLALHIENVPGELRKLRQWVLWKYTWNDERGEWAKVPFQTSGQAAKSNDPTTWTGFQDITRAYQENNRRYDGIGLACHPDSGVVGIDLDNCISVDVKADTATLTPFASRVVDLCDSYTEVSPSGTGLRILLRGAIPQSFKEPDIEMYQSGRYLTMTGVTWGPPKGIRKAQDALDRIVTGLQKRREAKIAKPEQKAVAVPVTLTLNAQERLDKAFASANGASIRALFRGDITGYQSGDEGQSRADLALCGKLAFWSGGDAGMLDQMFRASALMRPKWDKRHSSSGQTYGEMTVSEAMTGCGEFYGSQPAQVRQLKAEPVLTPEQDSARRSAFAHDIGDCAGMAIAYRRERNKLDRVSTGWPELDELYRPVPRFLTIATGAKNSGKSSFFDNLLVNLTRDEGWRHAVVSFESQPIGLHVLQICSLWARAPWSINREAHLPDADIEAVCRELQGHFIFHALPQADRTVDGVIRYTEDAIKRYGVKGLLFDPWSELVPPEAYRLKMNDFIQKGLTDLQSFTREADIHTWLVAHPNKDRANIGRDAKRPLDLDDISGSQMFSNKADYGITVHRPHPGQGEKDFTEIHVTKVRRGLPGRLGYIRTYWQMRDGSYEVARHQSNVPDIPEISY